MKTYIRKNDNEIFVKEEDKVLREISNIPVIEKCSNCKEHFEKVGLISVEDIVLCSDCFIAAINVIISKGVERSSAGHRADKL
jgi:hypothetical protein